MTTTRESMWVVLAKHKGIDVVISIHDTKSCAEGTAKDIANGNIRRPGGEFTVPRIEEVTDDMIFVGGMSEHHITEDYVRRRMKGSKEDREKFLHNLATFTNRLPDIIQWAKKYEK